ncbi:multinuclear nonheme iron-dependent oxidase [Vibrio fluvialis]|uniref:multinuclear nonheme iron-dependent oxidase n=1 Tax=Vibrio fluvialis TaxID=676 RepID=UPI00355B323F
MAGFEDGPEGEFLVDTHNQCINELVLDYLVQFAREHDIQTISVERDDNFNAREWMRDVDNVRGCQIHG